MRTNYVITLAGSLLPLVTQGRAQLVEPVSKDNSAECDCYIVDGPDSGYFQYHRFWDFRLIPAQYGDNFSAVPPLTQDDLTLGVQNVTSTYLSSANWTRDWTFLDGGSSNDDDQYPKTFSAQNIYVSYDTEASVENATYLTLRAARVNDTTYSSQITSTQENLLYASIRVRMRVIPNNSTSSSADGPLLDDSATGSNTSHPVDEGAVVGIFTYATDEQESDIEFLTRDATDQVHYTNQPNSTSQVTLPDGLQFTDWIDHRLDWFNGTTRWWVNGSLVLTKSTDVPTEPSVLILNTWGNGGSWTGVMAEGGQVIVGVEWIEMAFNVSGPADGVGAVDGSKKRGWEPSHQMKRQDATCSVVCSVDGVSTLGTPTPVSTAMTYQPQRIMVSNGMATILAHCFAMFGLTLGVTLFTVFF